MLPPIINADPGDETTADAGEWPAVWPEQPGAKHVIDQALDMLFASPPDNYDHRG